MLLLVVIVPLFIVTCPVSSFFSTFSIPCRITPSRVNSFLFSITVVDVPIILPVPSSEYNFNVPLFIKVVVAPVSILFPFKLNIIFLLSGISIASSAFPIDRFLNNFISVSVLSSHASIPAFIVLYVLFSSLPTCTNVNWAKYVISYSSSLSVIMSYSGSHSTISACFELVFPFNIPS